jgi:hypothetical protein
MDGLQQLQLVILQAEAEEVNIILMVETLDLAEAVVLRMERLQQTHCQQLLTRDLAAVAEDLMLVLSTAAVAEDQE